MKTDHRLRVRIPVLLALVSLPAIPQAHAADGTWTADADGNWSDIGNWSGGIVADGADFTATFDDVLTANRTVTLDTVRTIGNITFSDLSHNLSISGANTLTLDTTSGTPTISVAGGNNRELTINSVIAGSDGLLKTGGGEFRPRGANTFTGGITHSGGRISVADGTNEDKWLGDASNVITFTADAELYNENNQFTMPQGITINGGVTGSITGAFGERTQVDGVLAGSGTLVVTGFSAGFDAEFRNTGNTFTGPIEVNSGDSVTAGFASLADSPSTTAFKLDSQANNGARFEYMNLAIAPLVLNNRQFELIVNGNAGTNLGRQPGIVNSAPAANTITVNTDLLITGTGSKKFFLTGGNTGDNTFAGAIPDGVSGADLTLYKDGGGKWILTGANTYEGDTIILNGTLEIGGAGQLGGGSYAGNITNQDSTPSPFTFNSSADTTISGVISGAMDLIKDGAGTLSLTGANTYTGDTTVDGGTLSLGDGTNNGNLDDFSTVSVATGAVLDLNYTGSDTVLNLNLGGSPAAGGTWGATGSGADNIDDTFFSGTGVINNLGGDTTSIGVAFWDGGAVDIAGNGNAASNGGSGTWDAAIKNWDFGTVAHGAWLNTTSATANFGGSTGTVTLDADMSIENLNIEVPNGGGSGYFIGDAAEDNTLTFGGNATITVTATGSGSRNNHTIRAGIAGSPDVDIVGANNNNFNHFQLLPPAGVTMTLGSVNMINTRASNKTLVLGGASTGNVADAVTWTVTSNQLFVTMAGTGDWTITNNLNIDDGRLYVEEGTLTLGGTDNFFSHKVGVATNRRSNFTASNKASKLVVGGAFTINDNREWFVIQNMGTLAPGASVGTLNVDWLRNTGDVTNLRFENGSTYEWEVGAGNVTDVINLAEIGSQNVILDIPGTTTLKVIDAGGTPSAGDQLTVFTYDAGVTTPDTATLNANMTIDISGTSYSGSPMLMNDGAGTIYLTGLSGGAPATPYDAWADSYGLMGADRDFTADTEGGGGDGLNQLTEFAFGTDPTASTTDLVVVDGMNFTPGSPIFDVSTFGGAHVRFVRRVNYAAENLDYFVEFSHAMVPGTWEASTATPVQVSVSGDYEVVEIPWLFGLSSGKRAFFMRVRVVQN